MIKIRKKAAKKCFAIKALKIYDVDGYANSYSVARMLRINTNDKKAVTDLGLGYAGVGKNNQKLYTPMVVMSCVLLSEAVYQ